jgi:hypothetical protein
LIMKERVESNELKIYQSLNSRNDLSAKEKQYYAGLEKGFVGEKIFDQWLEPVLGNKILLPDMQFMPNNTYFQADSILITSKPTFLFEVKNYEGDHILEGENLYRTDGSIAKNPLLQIKRNEPLLHSILKSIGYKDPIESFAIFVNPRFHLYNAPKDLPIIYPSQRERFVEKFKQTTSFLKKPHTHLARQLITKSISDNPYAKIPNYNYKELRKGIGCPSCGEFYQDYYKVLECKLCGKSEIAKSAIVRSLREFKLLFPERNITTTQALEWCKVVKDKKTMRSILQENYKHTNIGRGSYFSERDQTD